MKHSHRVAIVQSTLKFSHLWPKFIQYKLTSNVRDQSDPAFCYLLVKLAAGNLPTNFGDDLIEIPSELTEQGSLIDSIFGRNIPNNLDEIKKLFSVRKMMMLKK